MHCHIPLEVLTGGWELLCYGGTLVAALLSYLLLGR
jgi:hypothetical protein